jgi:Acetyltransferase (GNAT) domain
MTDFQGHVDAHNDTPSQPAEPAQQLATQAHWMTLFNQDRFHALNLTDGQLITRAQARDETGRLVGSLGGVLDAGVFTSGYSAPFGGPDLVRERETPANVALLVDEAITSLTSDGARTLRVKLPPTCYGESEPLVVFTLLNRGFHVERCELNQHIDLETLDGPDSYIERLKSPARRALGKLLGPEFSFRRAETQDEWDRAYNTLAANRSMKGRSLSLSRAYVARAHAALSDSVRMYELFHGGLAIAAALVYRVRAQRDMVVAWGDGEHDLERSPMNLLAYRVVEVSLSEGVRTLDLGTSNGHGPGPDGAFEANTGLVQFKQSVLARIEPRLTLLRELTV